MGFQMVQVSPDYLREQGVNMGFPFHVHFMSTQIAFSLLMSKKQNTFSRLVAAHSIHQAVLICSSRATTSSI